MSDASQHYADQFSAQRASLPGAGLPWLTQLRDDGIALFASEGMPTQKIEDWKYTNLSALEASAFALAEVSENGVAREALPSLIGAEHRLVFVNGRFRADLSAICMPPQGVVVGRLADVLENDPESLADCLGRAGDAEGLPMLALNTAMMTDGLFLRLDDGVDLASVIEVIHVSVAGDEPTAHYPRNLIVAGANSHATIVEHHIGESGTTFANIATEIIAGEGAGIRHCKVQAEGPEAYHIATLQARLAKDASLDSFYFASGAKLSRNEIRVRLEGEGADCRLYGAYMMKDRQHADHTTVIDHAAPLTSSREVYKGVLDGRARAVFQGKILVRPDAQKIDGHQLNRTLLLSDKSEIDTKPELEIHADDVKCSHGATTGEIDEDALFYLRARGIPEEEARGMLVEAFLREVIDGIAMAGLREPLADRVAHWMDARGHTR